MAKITDGTLECIVWKVKNYHLDSHSRAMVEQANPHMDNTKFYQDQ